MTVDTGPGDRDDRLFGNVHPTLRVVLVVSAAAGMVIAIWATALAVGWNEESVADWVPESALLAALAIGALLAADTVLPLPATILMLGSGAVLGPVTGGIVNAIGLALGALGGYGLGRILGRRGSKVTAPLETRPMWMVAATRGLPILSESVAVGAGALSFPLPAFVRAAAFGSIGAGLVWSIAGALARDHWSLVFVAAALATAAYVAASSLQKRASKAAAGAGSAIIHQ